MRKRAGILLGKSTLKLNKSIGRGATALPGLMADSVAPNLLKHILDRNFPDGIIMVTGTNGKTTTARLIASILNEAGISFIHNASGSNLVRGILSSLLASCDYNGRIDAQMAVLEVDEATVGTVLDACTPKITIVTNLFRDQLDRYGEVNILAAKIRKQIQASETKLLLNADDPIVTSLAIGLKRNKVNYFGLNTYPGRQLAHDQAVDITTSPISNSPLIYKKRYLGHLGIYKSQNGDFVRPNLDYSVEKITTKSDTSTVFSITDNLHKTSYELPIGGLYNIYNAVAAIATGEILGIKPEIMKTAVKKSTAAFGRVEIIDYHDRKLQLLLIKNPTGFNQIIQSFLSPDKQDPLLILINDNFADGRDVSWLWDVAIEELKDYQGPIVVGGLRGFDMALRLKYAGIEQAQVELDVGKAIEYAVKRAKKDQRIYVLPTYTAMLQARKYLVKNAKIPEFWQ